MSLLLILLNSLLLVSPAFAAELVTMYHIHPYTASADPSNMNLGDLAGDLFFDIAELIMLLPCSTQEDAKGLPAFVACNNKEIWGDTSVISQLVVEVTGGYGSYVACNICTADGNSPLHPDHTCQPGDYVCDCDGGRECTDPRVGRTIPGGPGGRYHETLCRDPDYRKRPHQFFCAIAVAVNRLRGYWYTTLGIGKDKTWRVLETIKTISKQCHQQSFLSDIEARGDCFEDECPRGDPCYVECFIQTTLGSEALDSPNSQGGMSKEELVEAWARPFQECPDIRRGYAMELANAMSHMLQLL
ncbi:expressed unknown protein [Seminavis robusta]|uniref:Uncharacterized protein n=1 Tax=Seminavis robusta TaxID=568900 RepID=A0A9N8HPZ7_9STRA|nr:expressed unknown protein [Seminavis robusta]|eukprot:Sro1143_g245980.1 n/a (301) ;mRNA; f:16162-17064